MSERQWKWKEVESWLPILRARRKMQQKARELETEKQKVAAAPRSRGEVLELLQKRERDAVMEVEKIATAAAHALAGIHGEWATPVGHARDVWVDAALAEAARKYVEKEGKWLEGAMSAEEKEREIARLDEQIAKLKADLDLKKVRNTKLLKFNEEGQPIAFRPDSWIRELKEELGARPTRDANGAPLHDEEKMRAIQILEDFL